MNEILELIEKARIEVGCDNYCEQVMTDLYDEIKRIHQADVINSYNRGMISSLLPNPINAEQYYQQTFNK